jgi:hypothetical protein
MLHQGRMGNRNCRLLSHHVLNMKSPLGKSGGLFISARDDEKEE